ncbi:MAG: hypothetical protein Kow00121_34490 [Elainellaceae cyanobacterium]
MLSWVQAVESSLRYTNHIPSISGKDILERIKARAIAQWGQEKWIAGLVNEYVKIAQANGDDKATAVNRRPQLERAFKVGSCTLDTAIMLAAAVGCRFQMACIDVKIEEF